MEDFRYKSLKPWKIENIDLTEQFSLSIFTNFLYQSIKITWLLPIFIETDFYRLTSPGSKGLWKISTYVTESRGGGGGGIEKVSIKTPTISLLIDSEKGSVTAGL